MKRKEIFIIKIILFFIITFFISTLISTEIYAQESDILNKIIKGNEFLLKSDLVINIGLSYIFDTFPSNINDNYFNIFYNIIFSYQLFNWLDFYFYTKTLMGFDNWYLDFSHIYFTLNFNEAFTTLPFQSDLKFGLFQNDFSLYKNFYNEKPYYFGIAPFYIEYEKLALLLNLRWWLIELSSGIFGVDESAGFFKLIFSFYDFAYLSFTTLFPIKISSANISSTYFFEFALTTGLLDILAYFIPSSYLDQNINENMPAYSFGVNIALSFLFSKSSKLELKIFGDYNDPNSQDSFELIDFLNEIYFPSSYNFNQKHPSRIGLGLEYKGEFTKNFNIYLVSYFYYSFSSSIFIFNIYSKINFYYFYAEFNYFPYYYPVIKNNDLSICVGLQFSL